MFDFGWDSTGKIIVLPHIPKLKNFRALLPEMLQVPKPQVQVPDPQVQVRVQVLGTQVLVQVLKTDYQIQPKYLL